MIHLRLAPGHRVEPAALGIFWHDVAFHIVPLIVGSPQILPVLRLLEVALVDIHAT